MSTCEHDTVLTDSGQPAVQLALKLIGILLGITILAVVLFVVAAYGRAQMLAHARSVSPLLSESAHNSWTIEGALTEACTCSVPCTCNFGEGPSPHHYCYSLYAYDIRKGKYGNVTLDGLHFGATELKSGKTIFIDERADERQRHALRVIAARIISHLSAEEAEKRAKSDSRVRYAAVKQEYDGRRHLLDVTGVGEFSAGYIMGLDKNSPIVVRNNTTWRILDAIKGKTRVFRVKLGQDNIDTKDTNSNQGDFVYTDKMNFASSEYSSCSSSMNAKARTSGDEQLCGE
jgi:hypothetical protein